MYPYNTHRDNKTKDKPAYYCMHCGHRSFRAQWAYARCPRCGAATPPKKW